MTGLQEESIPCPGCAEGWAPLSAKYCNACYEGQIERLATALRRIKSLDEKNVSKYAQQIADEALTHHVGRWRSGS